MYCPSDNTQAIDQSHFWGSGSHWDAHRVGWVVAGICTLVTIAISAMTVLNHCRNYTKPAEQRQIIRILYTPPITAIISFLSYRFFRSYTYYSLIEVVYKSITLSAFMLLLIEYVASTSTGHSAQGALAKKDERALPGPFCCWRYRPTKASFIYKMKWSVMQYVVIRPALSIAGIICQHLNVLCESSSFNVHFASLYLDIIDTFSVNIALYGLIVFYDLTKDELAGRRPLAKFLSIKLIVIFTFFQSLLFTALEGHVIHGTEFWTSTNIADGLNALTTCMEMICFAVLMMWSYNWKEYQVQPGEPDTSILRPLWDSINLWDFAVEIGSEFSYFASRITGRQHQPAKRSFGRAFGVESYVQVEGSSEYATSYASHTGYDEDVHLTPYKASAPDLSRAGSSEDVDKYGPKESTVAA
ncbi:DUF300-domain-containing protein [Russula aff. rugulosa BPL654]|nr:DUF300-domain-containing protein [Russula aff. rugulosa BPL654]